MLNNLSPQPADKILALGQMYRKDPRDQKIDLGVGVYKNAEGVTPVMRAIKAAERQLVDAQTSKSYVSLAGDPEFCAAIKSLILADSVADERLATVATPGGTGACRQAFELFQLASPEGTVWVSDPTWPNHLSILKHIGQKTRSYRYFDSVTRAVDFAGMMEDLGEAKAGDLVLLHGCCHNPTGANLGRDEWNAVAELLLRSGATPMVDIAYQGFGDGLEEDALGTRILAAQLPELLIAASCSKNFGVYRERTGALMALADNPDAAALSQANLAFLNRQNYSFPPDHGARVVTMVLNDPELRSDWQAELESVRLGMLDLRQQLADELRQRSNSDRFDFIASHRGMFSRLGASPEQVETLRTDHGIYMVGDSRVNIAGLNAKTVPILADAIISVGI